MRRPLLAYLYTPRSRLPEFAPGQRSCDCLRCRSHAWRDLRNWTDRMRKRWHYRVTCPLYGHQFPDQTYSWKTWCYRCLCPRNRPI